jgi:hypothetical protein
VLEASSTFICATFFFVSAQPEAQKGVDTPLALTATGLTVALARRLRGVIVAVADRALLRTVPQHRAPAGERA